MGVDLKLYPVEPIVAGRNFASSVLLLERDYYLHAAIVGDRARIALPEDSKVKVELRRLDGPLTGYTGPNGELRDASEDAYHEPLFWARPSELAEAFKAAHEVERPGGWTGLDGWNLAVWKMLEALPDNYRIILWWC